MSNWWSNCLHKFFWSSKPWGYSWPNKFVRTTIPKDLFQKSQWNTCAQKSSGNTCSPNYRGNRCSIKSCGYRCFFSQWDQVWILWIRTFDGTIIWDFAYLRRNIFSTFRFQRKSAKYFEKIFRPKHRPSFVCFLNEKIVPQSFSILLLSLSLNWLPGGMI